MTEEEYKYYREINRKKNLEAIKPIAELVLKEVGDDYLDISEEEYENFLKTGAKIASKIYPRYDIGWDHTFKTKAEYEKYLDNEQSHDHLYPLSNGWKPPRKKD